MPRAATEWIATHPDQKIPERIKLRIWAREGGVCYLTGRKIMPGDARDFDHKIALINGGQHREFNIFPVLRDKHKEKTKADIAEKATIAAIQAKHLGVKSAPARPMQSRDFAPPEKKVKSTATPSKFANMQPSRLARIARGGK
jgi:5-methylcytosine-specific restriction protein A